jgi:hypothetical protein
MAKDLIEELNRIAARCSEECASYPDPVKEHLSRIPRVVEVLNQTVRVRAHVEEARVPTEEERGE